MADQPSCVYLRSATHSLAVPVHPTCLLLQHPWGLGGWCLTVLGEARCACGQYALVWEMGEGE